MSELEETNAQTQTPGLVLKKARMAQGLAITDVASRLCLSPHFIEDIENDDYSRMSAHTYARGYIRSYARMMGISDEEIASSLANVTMVFPASKKMVSLGKEQSIPVYQALESSQPRSSLLIWGTILVAMILVALLIMWWQGPKISAKMIENGQPVPAKSSTEIPLEPQSPTQSQSQPSASPASPPSSSPPTPRRVPSNQAPAQKPEQLPRPSASAPPPASSDQSALQPSDLSENNLVAAPPKQPPGNRVMKPNAALPEPRETNNE